MIKLKAPILKPKNLTFRSPGIKPLYQPYNPTQMNEAPLFIHTFVYICIYIYIYIERERWNRKAFTTPLSLNP